MPPRRVAVTGLGIISPLGHNLAENWEQLRAGRSAIGPITSVDCSTLRFQNGAEVRGFDPLAHFEGGKDAQIDRFAQFAVVTAREAMRDSGVALTLALREQSAVISGSSVGGQLAIDEGYQDLFLKGRGRVHPLTIPRTMSNA